MLLAENDDFKLLTHGERKSTVGTPLLWSPVASSSRVANNYVAIKSRVKVESNVIVCTRTSLQVDSKSENQIMEHSTDKSEIEGLGMGHISPNIEGLMTSLDELLASCMT